MRANFHPAVAEAHQARVPLVVLTADRPPEVRDWGAAQTIDQIGLYGRHVRWFAEVATPDADATPLRYARSLASRAVAEATTRLRYIAICRGQVTRGLRLAERRSRSLMLK